MATDCVSNQPQSAPRGSERQPFELGRLSVVARSEQSLALNYQPRSAFPPLFPLPNFRFLRQNGGNRLERGG
jgi:hypothetical protein